MAIERLSCARSGRSCNRRWSLGRTHRDVIDVELFVRRAGRLDPIAETAAALLTKARSTGPAAAPLSASGCPPSAERSYAEPSRARLRFDEPHVTVQGDWATEKDFPIAFGARTVRESFAVPWPRTGSEGDV
jgi:hypothetical protein